MFFSSAENVAIPDSWCAAKNSGNETTQTCFRVPLGWNAQKRNKRNHDLAVKSESDKKPSFFLVLFAAQGRIPGG